MSHTHHHTSSRLSRTLIVCSVVNFAYVIAEAAVGLAAGSAGLVSDAGHNMSDVLTLLISLAAIRIAAAYPRRAAWLSIINALLLIAAVALIAVEGICKIVNPEPVGGGVIAVTAGIGIVVNGVTAWILMKDRNEDTNIRASFLHMLSDTLVSVGVLVSGLVISRTGLSIIDPLISLAVAVIILVPALRLLKESVEQYRAVSAR